MGNLLLQVFDTEPTETSIRLCTLNLTGVSDKLEDIAALGLAATQSTAIDEQGRDVIGALVNGILEAENKLNQTIGEFEQLADRVQSRSETVADDMGFMSVIPQ